MPRVGAGKYKRVRSPKGQISYAAEIVIRGKRIRRRFATKGQAESWLKQSNVEIVAHTHPLSSQQILDASAAINLSAGRMSLAEAMELAVRVRYGTNQIATPSAVGQYLQDKFEQRKSKRTHDDYRTYLDRFQRGVKLPLAEITHQHITGWLRSEFATDESRNAVRRKLYTFFEWCVAHRYVLDNPVKYVPRAKQIPNKPRFFDVETSRTFLHHLRDNDPELVPRFALLFFTGARPSEIDRIDASQIADEELVLYSGQTKTHEERIVPIPGNLAAWLREFPPRGRVAVTNQRKRFRDACDSLGLEWIQDGTRHTYASMHLATYQDPGRTALYLGHRQQNVLWRHYRGAVRQAEAVRYWEIAP